MVAPELGCAPRLWPAPRTCAPVCHTLCPRSGKRSCKVRTLQRAFYRRVVMKRHGVDCVRVGCVEPGHLGDVGRRMRRRRRGTRDAGHRRCGWRRALPVRRQVVQERRNGGGAGGAGGSATAGTTDSGSDAPQRACLPGCSLTVTEKATCTAGLIGDGAASCLTTCFCTACPKEAWLASGTPSARRSSTVRRRRGAQRMPSASSPRTAGRDCRPAAGLAAAESFRMSAAAPARRCARRRRRARVPTQGRSSRERRSCRATRPRRATLLRASHDERRSGRRRGDDRRRQRRRLSLSQTGSVRRDPR